jgi:branched-chain amino acid transport system permease protein
MTSQIFRGEFLVSRHRFRPVETLPWVFAVLVFFVFPDYLLLGSQVLIMILFALSLDLILGYAGIISLGHAALFGTGAYAAGILSAHGGWGEPLTGLAVAAVAAALVGLISGWVILRTRGLTLLMLTMATTILLQELANEQEEITGGDDGLQGVSMDPLLGTFEFDLVGETAYLYSLAVSARPLIVRCSGFTPSLRPWLAWRVHCSPRQLNSSPSTF